MRPFLQVSAALLRCRLFFSGLSCYTKPKQLLFTGKDRLYEALSDPLLVLDILLLAGSALWFRSGPVPSAESTSPVESTGTGAESLDESKDGSDHDSPLSSADLPPDKTAPTEIAPTDPAPADERSPAPPESPAESQPDSTSKTESAPPQVQIPPAAEEPVPYDQTAVPVEDISAMAQDLLAEMNRERAASGIDPLTLDQALSSVASLRAKEGTTHFGHTRPDGPSYRSAVDSAGLSYRSLGENLATGHTSAQAVIHDWNNSDGHHDNIVSERFAKVGIGLTKNNGNPHAGYTWAVIFSD